MPHRAFGRVVLHVERAAVERWSQRSLYVARRNALRASVELARRRREQEEVEAFLRRDLVSRSARPEGVPASR